MKRIDPADLARGRWHEILPAFGIGSEFLMGRHGPCPICREGEDRFRYDNQEGRGTWICSVCGAGDGFHLAMRVTGKDFKEVVREVERLVVGVEPKPAPPVMSDEAKKEALRRLWRMSLPMIAGDLGDTYLKTRKLGLRDYPESLRVIERVKAGGVECAAILAIVSDKAGKPVTMHRTYLKPDGSGKAEIEAPRRLMPGEVPKGAAIRLDPPLHGGVLGIAEGLETAIAAMLLYEMPVWSAINATMLAGWEPPDHVTEVVIFADNDPKYAGHAAGYTLAHRLACRGLEVQVKTPPNVGDDWADVWARL